MRIMKTKIVFLWLFVLLTTAAIGQNLTISSSGYSSRSCTDGEINVRPGTEVTIITTLPVGATATYWTADQILSATNPAQSFPITAPAANTVSLVMPVTYDEIVVTVYYNTTPTSSSYVKLIRNTNTADGLLTVQQDVQDCPGVSKNFTATTDALTGFSYEWQEFTTSWVSLGISSYYSVTGRVLNLQTHVSIEGKRFRAFVKNDNCLGAIDTTAEVIVQDVYEQPTATFSPNTNVCAGDQVSLVVSPTNGQAPYTVSLNNNTGDLVIPNNVSPVTGIGVGGTATFSVQPSATVTYHFIVTDSNGCSITY